MNDPRFTIGCITQLTDKGVQQTVDVFGDVMRRAVNVQAAQMEAGVRAKLIELGWTPPLDPAMTTTEEVPMPEPDYCLHNLPQNPLYGPTKLRAYADARCAKLQAAHDLAVQGWAEGARLAEGRLQAMQAERDSAAANLTKLREAVKGMKFDTYEATTSAMRGIVGANTIHVIQVETLSHVMTVIAAIDAAGGDQC